MNHWETFLKVLFLSKTSLLTIPEVALRVFRSIHLADVYPSLVLVVGSVAHRQAELVLDIGAVQIHFLEKKTRNSGYTSLFI